MDPHGNHHRSNECELDHECDQEIQEAIQQVPQQVIHPESNGYELDHESGQEVVQQTNQEQDNRSELVHGLDEIESQESSEDEGSHGSIEMNIQEISTTRHYRGYTLPFNFRALDWKFLYLKWTRKLLYRRIVTATVAVIDDAAIVDLPMEELFPPRTSTLLPKNAGKPDGWNLVTREVAGDPCFFILYYSQSQIGTAMLDCISPEYYERLARTKSLQGASSTHTKALRGSNQRQQQPFIAVDYATPESTVSPREFDDLRDKFRAYSASLPRGRLCTLRSKN
ncbi:hypothetical protein BPAE_0014g00280 [Botrytis paeoniae]|uniref:Uncharacterized protein n=1 Tax=Botrytis paeoniae TaxID=278948 RepID=A0A4Z1G608_9HELO|nr:hypothetical protein BPAE_0014g00280 [Botrytis paeoniae]